MTNTFFKDPNNRKHVDIKAYLTNIDSLKKIGDELVNLKIYHNQSTVHQGSI